MIYLSYFLGNIVIMRARARGWPRTSAPFKLGRWGILVNIVALLYGGAMLINFAWPRALSNPKPNQTNGLLDFHIGFLNKIPILWTVVVFIALVGRHLLPDHRPEEGIRAGHHAARGRPGGAGGRGRRRGRGLAPAWPGRSGPGSRGPSSRG